MIRFSALGALGLESASPDGRELRAVLTQPRLVALLTYLMVARPSGFHRRDSLIALFWPEHDQQHARNALRQVVHRLRRELGVDCITSRGAEEIGVDTNLVWCDALAFETALRDNRPVDALELYRGDLLPGFFVGDAPAFEQWLDAERRRFRDSAAATARKLADAESEPAAAVRWARRAAEIIPDDEVASRRLIELLLKTGDRAGALKAYDALARRLAGDFEIEPSIETQRLVAGLQDANATLLQRTSLPSQPVTLLPIPAEPPQRVGRSRLQWALAGALLLSVVGVGAAARVLRAPDANPGVRTLAVLPFTVRAGSDVQFLRNGMVDLLSAKLNGASGFRAIDPQAVIASPSAAEKADWIIRGDVVEIAGRLQLSATLFDARRGERAAATASVEGETSALFQLVDDLTGRILAGIAVGRDTALTRLGAMTTHSLPALKAFLEGEQMLRAGHEARAAAAFRQAVNEDSTFAMAHYRLALASVWASVPDAGNPAIAAAAAVRHSKRLSPVVRDLLVAYSAYRAFDADEAERMYRAISGAHPEYVEAWLMLGEVAFHYNPARGRSPAEGRAPFERVLALDPTNTHAVIHLARLAALEGRIEDLDSLAGRYARLHPDTEKALEMRALVAYAYNDSAARVAIARQVRDADDINASTIIQAALVFAQNLEAVTDFQLPAGATRHPVSTIGVRWTLTDAVLARGIDNERDVRRVLGSDADMDWHLETAALLATDPFFAAPPKRVLELRSRIARLPRYSGMSHPFGSKDDVLNESARHYLLALLSIRLGEYDTATAHIAAMASIASGAHGPHIAGLIAGAKAELARSRGLHAEALTELERFPFKLGMVVDLVHFGARERILYGDVLRAMGRDREALSWYNAMPGGYDLALAPIAHYRRGEIHERLGNPAAARFHYERFVNMWRNASPERQVSVDRARQALARLSAR